MRDFNILLKTPSKRKLPLKGRLFLLNNPPFVVGMIVTLVSVFVFPFTVEEMRTMYHLRLYSQLIEGEIVDAWVEIQETENRDAILGYEYVFSSQEIGEFRGVSYGEGIIYPIGQRIPIYYDIHEPYYNRASTLMVSTSKASSMLLPAVLFIGGLTAVIYGCVVALYRRLYLERGHITIASVKSRKQFLDENPQEETSLTLIFHFTDIGGEARYISSISSSPRMKNVGNHSPVVYLKDTPHNAKLVLPWGDSADNFAQDAIEEFKG